MHLLSIRYENVRAFTDATLVLEKRTILLVGRNNSGKTSALKLLAWLLSEETYTRLADRSHLNQYERALLLPAKEVGHRARRLTLKIRIPDGRTARRYDCVDKIATLRFGFRVTPKPRVFVQLGKPTKTSGSNTDDTALELLEALQRAYAFVYIPAARDASSERYQSRLRQLYDMKLAPRVLHHGKPGKPIGDYTRITSMLSELEGIANTALSELLQEMSDLVPSELLDNCNVTLADSLREHLVATVVDNLLLNVKTGGHDEKGVGAVDVGSGLQSLLDLMIALIVGNENSSKKHIVAIEEPEAYLHPSVQRVFARQLLSGTFADKTIISTHSPIFVDESQYANICLANDRTFRWPAAAPSVRRGEIHSRLLTGPGAEMIFYSSVLLVEGDGDRMFFEGLRRRLAAIDETGRIDNMIVVQVGGKTSFGPWIKLLLALNVGPAQNHISFVAAPDGDAVHDICRALREAGIDIPAGILSTMQHTHERMTDGNYDLWREGLTSVNEMLTNSKQPVPVYFLVGDLESAIFLDLSEEGCRQLANSLDITFQSKEDFIKTMGSKAIDGSGSDKNKAPHLRKAIAENIELSDLSTSLRLVMDKWLTNAGLEPKEIANSFS